VCTARSVLTDEGVLTPSIYVLSARAGMGDTDTETIIIIIIIIIISVMF